MRKYLLKNSLSKKEIRNELFRRGSIAAWYLRPPSQVEVFNLLRSTKNPFIETARRWGKTTTVLVHCLEFAIRNPGTIVRWCEPWKNQAREIVIPEMDNIQKWARNVDRFVYQKTDSVYEHRSGSKIFIRGVNEDRGESARGPKADIIVADEFGSWRDPEYTVSEVLRPQLLTTNGQFIFTGTPPEDLGHSHYEHKERAIKEKRFIQKTIFDNEWIDQERIDEIIRECGGPESPAWLREYLCKPVANPERLVIPEYKEELHDIDDNMPRPPYYDPYVGIDLGFNDNTFLVFGYHDFLTRTFVVEDELSFSGKNSREIAERSKEVEKRLWPVKPYLRISDNDLQQLHDMATLCDYQLVPTRKDEKLAAINALRVRFAQGRIKIKKRCEALRFQLKVGLWNERRTDYVRGTKTGHLDGIDALVYLDRNIVESHNPYPIRVPDIQHEFVSKRQVSDKDGELLKDAILPFGNPRIKAF